MKKPHDSTVLQSGWLTKIEKNNRIKRWFVLFQDHLIYYKDEDCKRIKGKLDTTHLKAFVRTESTDKNEFVLKTFVKSIVVRAEEYETARTQIKAVDLLSRKNALKLRATSRNKLLELEKTEKEKLIAGESAGQLSNHTSTKSINEHRNEASNTSSGNAGSPSTTASSTGTQDDKNSAVQTETCEAVLEDPIGVKYFSEFLREEFTAQHIEFQLAARDFVQYTEEAEENMFSLEYKKEILEKVFEMFDTYIVEECESIINIGKRIRDPLTIINRILVEVYENDEYTAQDFDESAQRINAIVQLYQCAQYDVFKMLRGSFRRFKRSKIYTKFIDEIRRASESAGGDDRISLSLVPRGSCKRDDCSCDFFKNQDNTRLKTCTNCEHFYEEHLVIDSSVTGSGGELANDKIEQRKTPSGSVSVKQRQKLQMLLGMTDEDFGVCDAELKTDSRRKFLEETIYAVINLPENPLKVGERRISFKKFKYCFIAKEFTSCITRHLSLSRKEAKSIAIEMMDYKLFKSVMKEQGFIDGNVWHRFTRYMIKRLDELEKIMGEEEAESDEESFEDNAEVSVTRKEEDEGDEMVDLLDLFTSTTSGKDKSEKSGGGDLSQTSSFSSRSGGKPSTLSRSSKKNSHHPPLGRSSREKSISNKSISRVTSRSTSGRKKLGNAPAIVPSLSSKNSKDLEGSEPSDDEFDFLDSFLESTPISKDYARRSHKLPTRPTSRSSYLHPSRKSLRLNSLSSKTSDTNSSMLATRSSSSSTSTNIIRNSQSSISKKSSLSQNSNLKNPEPLHNMKSKLLSSLDRRRTLPTSRPSNSSDSTLYLRHHLPKQRDASPNSPNIVNGTLPISSTQRKIPTPEIGSANQERQTSLFRPLPKIPPPGRFRARPSDFNRIRGPPPVGPPPKTKTMFQYPIPATRQSEFNKSKTDEEIRKNPPSRPLPPLFQHKSKTLPHPSYNHNS